MQEALLISIFNLTAAVVCLISAVRMYFVVKENPNNKRIQYFFYSFVFIFVYFLTNGLPYLIIDNPFSLLSITSLFRPFLLIGGMFLLLTPINFTRFRSLENLYIYFVLILIIFSNFLIFWGLREISDSTLGLEIGYIVRPENILVISGMLVAGATFAISLFLATSFYFISAFRMRDNYFASSKAVMIGIGCLFFLIGATLNYIVGIYAENFIFTNTVASLFFMTGSISLISSVNYKEVDNKK